jgi:hypothetical protein
LLFSASFFSLSAAQTSIPATAKIWGAGHAVPPAPAGGGAGVLPTLLTIPAGADRTVVFSSVTGEIRYAPHLPLNGADGTATTAFPVAPNWGGIAGADFATRARYLSGVFLDDTEPVDPAPDSMVFLNGAFTELSPGLCQIFFVGDGLTGEGTGTAQTFHIPDSATRLFLGFQDFYGTTPYGPGGYADNSGSITLTATFDGVVVGIADSGPPQRGSTLHQNFPNPFNPTTSIRYDLDEPSTVTLRIFDAAGRVVRTLRNGVFEAAGPHEAVWNGRDDTGRAVSSGVYFYKLDTGSARETRRMTFLK